MFNLESMLEQYMPKIRAILQKEMLGTIHQANLTEYIIKKHYPQYNDLYKLTEDPKNLSHEDLLKKFKEIE